jgi:hypothetical protein
MKSELNLSCGCDRWNGQTLRLPGFKNLFQQTARAFPGDADSREKVRAYVAVKGDASRICRLQQVPRAISESWQALLSKIRIGNLGVRFVCLRGSLDERSAALHPNFGARSLNFSPPSAPRNASTISSMRATLRHERNLLSGILLMSC